MYRMYGIRKQIRDRYEHRNRTLELQLDSDNATVLVGPRCRAGARETLDLSIGYNARRKLRSS